MIQVFIKNMVCARCLKSVTGIFSRTGADIRAIRLGIAELNKPLSEEQKEKIGNELLLEGFELLDNKKAKLVQQVKQLIIDLVHYKELDEMKENFSFYLSRQLQKDYNYLSNLFSAFENITIEHFFILQKIEKVKEWLVYDELTLSEIAFRLNYSSVAHLSAQFKKITGFTPSQFKKLKDHHRKHIDSL